jgi:hypothetical protein
MAQTTVLAGASRPSWQTGAVSKNGVPRHYRVNAALRRASDRNLYPYRLEVVVPLADPGWAGLPTAAETQRLAGIEAKVLAAVGARAVLAAEITARGARWYIFYTGDGELPAELSHPLREACGENAVRVLGEADGDWQTYRHVLRYGRRKVLGFALLCAMPVLCGALALAAYGPVWALGDAVMVAAPIGLIVRGRRDAQWCLAHRALMFGGYVLLLAAILFVVAARFGLPPWASLVAGVAVATALIASVWKAQLRYWREQVPAGTTA